MNNKPDNKRTYMAKLDIIQQGDTGKYQLVIDRDGFDPQTCDFTLRLSWGYRGESLEIRKEEMFHDEEWNIFFMFDSRKMLGAITTECEYLVLDSDVEEAGVANTGEYDWYRVNVDRQTLCLVTTSANAMVQKGACKCSCREEHFVHYKRTLRSDSNSLYAIVRANQEIVKTSDGSIVRIRKSNLT